MTPDYDQWLYSQIPDDDPISACIVDVRGGVFAWKLFCEENNIGTCDPWAWQRCLQGPITNKLAKIVFGAHCALSFLRACANGQRSSWRGLNIAQVIDYADPEYMEACSQVEQQWRGYMGETRVQAVQLDDWSIVLRPTAIQ